MDDLVLLVPWFCEVANMMMTVPIRIERRSNIWLGRYVDSSAAGGSGGHRPIESRE